MDLIPAVPSAEMGGGSAVAISTLWVLQPPKEPQQVPGLQSSWSHAGKKHSPPPGLGAHSVWQVSKQVMQRGGKCRTAGNVAQAVAKTVEKLNPHQLTP